METGLYEGKISEEDFVVFSAGENGSLSNGDGKQCMDSQNSGVMCYRIQ